MATTKKSTSTKTITDDSQIISAYMDYVLTHDKEPRNVFIFCKENHIDESLFYSFFSSVESLKEQIWERLFENALQTLHKDENYASYSQRNKMLSLYFTLFELFTLNRSYLVFTLPKSPKEMQHLKQLRLFRKHFMMFVDELASTQTNERDAQVQKVTKPIFQQGAWLQFLFLLKFWLEDTSKGFEKTDIAIEKTVKATFDLLDTTPFESLIDFGKFLWKEKFQ